MLAGRAEIGNATVGSLASCTSKDSSLKAPGTFGSLVATVTYVSHTGEACPCHRLSGQDPMRRPRFASHLIMPSELARAWLQSGHDINWSVCICPSSAVGTRSVRTVGVLHAVDDDRPGH